MSRAWRRRATQSALQNPPPACRAPWASGKGTLHVSLSGAGPHPASRSLSKDGRLSTPYGATFSPGEKGCRRAPSPSVRGSGGVRPVIRELTSPRHALDIRRVGQGVAGAGPGGNAVAHVAQLDLDAFDVETHQRAIGEGENDDAGRRIRLLERHRQQIERRIRTGLRKSEMRDLQHAVEPQHTGDALLGAGLRADPVVAHAGNDESTLPRQPGHIDAFDAGVLNMRGNDAQALPVERYLLV